MFCATGASASGGKFQKGSNIQCLNNGTFAELEFVICNFAPNLLSLSNSVCYDALRAGVFLDFPNTHGTASLIVSIAMIFNPSFTLG